MRFEQVRLVALDLDGTVLNDAKQITPRTRSAIRELARRGVVVTFNTGRMLSSVRRFARQLEVAGPWVMLNGCLVCSETGEPLLRASLPTSVLASSLLLSRDRPCSLFWFCGEKILSEPRWIGDYHHMRAWDDGLDLCTLDRLESRGAPEVLHVHWMAAPETAALLAREMEDRHAELEVWIYASRPGPLVHVEVRQAGHDKGTGLERLLSHHRLDAEQCLAMGDWSNDVELMRTAGIGVAMANAVPEVKLAADLVLDHSNEEEGVARFLERSFGLDS